MKDNKEENSEGIISISLLAITLLISSLLISSSGYISHWLKLEQFQSKANKNSQKNNRAALEKLSANQSVVLLECIGAQQLCAINASQTKQKVIPDWEYYFRDPYKCLNSQAEEISIKDFKSELSCLDEIPANTPEIFINSNYKTARLSSQKLRVLAVAGSIEIKQLIIDSEQMLILALDQITIDQISSINAAQLIIYSATNQINIAQATTNTRIDLLANVHSLSDYQWIKTLPALTVGLLNAP